MTAAGANARPAPHAAAADAKPSIKPDMDEAERFLGALDPTTTRFTFQTFDDDKARREARAAEAAKRKKKIPDPFAKILHGTLAQHWEGLVELHGKRAGIFVTINETNLRGRTIKDVVKVRAVLVDLDGSPLKPVLAHDPPPHIVVESSPGKFHAYWRVADVALDQFTTIQKILIDRFGGDKAVHDLPRVMRLPGFAHQKDIIAAPPFVTRMIEEREGTCGLADFPLPKPNGGGATTEDHTQYAAGNGQDQDAKVGSRWGWLNTTALQLQNQPLWVPYLFTGTEFNPQKGHRISSQALGRDNQEDISITPQGIKDFGVHDLGDAREGRRTPLDLVIEYGKKTFPEAVAWLCEKLGISARGVQLDDFYAYMPMHQYMFAPSRELWPASSVNGRIGSVEITGADGKPKLIPAARWLDQHQAVEQITWAPGMPMLIRNRLISEGGWINRNGLACFNLYRPPAIIPGDAAKATPWVDHCHRVYGQDDAAHIIKWLAHRVQRPHEKINHALVLGGAQGIGKDTLLEPVKQAVGPWNFIEVAPKQVVGQFNGFLKSVVLRINEARDLGDTDRYKFYDHMKAYTASPPDVLRVNEKHLREHSVLNLLGAILTTNHKTNGIYLPADDRRHYVAWSDVTKEDFTAEYWDEIWDWYDEGGLSHVAAYLAQLDISSFNPKAPPPKTPAFWDIVNANRAPEDSELADALDRIGNPPATTLLLVAAKADSSFQEWCQDRRNRRQMPYRFEQCGYMPVRNECAKDGLWKIGDARQVIYGQVSLSVSERIKAATDLVSEEGRKANVI